MAPDDDTIDLRPRFARMRRCEIVAGCGLPVLVGSLAYCWAQDLPITNTGWAIPVALGMLALFPVIVYGCYLSILHWKVCMPFPRARSVLIVALILSVVQVSGTNLLGFFFLFYYLVYARPQLRRLA